MRASTFPYQRRPPVLHRGSQSGSPPPVAGRPRAPSTRSGVRPRGAVRPTRAGMPHASSEGDPVAALDGRDRVELDAREAPHRGLDLLRRAAPCPGRSPCAIARRRTAVSGIVALTVQFYPTRSLRADRRPWQCLCRCAGSRSSVASAFCWHSRSGFRCSWAATTTRRAAGRGRRPGGLRPDAPGGARRSSAAASPPCSSSPPTGAAGTRSARLCRKKAKDVVCVYGGPYTTSGEAQAISRLADQRGWDTLILVSPDYEQFRLERAFRRCGDFRVATHGVDEPWWSTAIGIPLEWVKLAVSETVRRSC